MHQKRNPFMSFIHYYPRVLEGIIAFGDMMQALMQTLIIGVGLPVILIGLLIVEHHGVMDGILYFATQDMAFLGALVLVGTNLAVEIQIVHTENRAGYNSITHYDWSFQLLVQEWKYRVGSTKSWKPRSKSPAHRFYGLRAFVTAAVFILALGGRMHANIEKVSAVPLAKGIQQLETESTLADVVTWLGGTVFTMVALVSAQVLTHYIAQQVIQITADMKHRLTTLKALETRTRNRAGGQRRDLPDGHGQLPASADGQAMGIGTDTAREHGHGQGYDRNSAARAAVREHLKNNPADIRLSSRALAAKLEGLAGKTVVAEVLAEVKAGQQLPVITDVRESAIQSVLEPQVVSSNGHSEEGQS